jgi:hypothetical protein
VRILVVFAVSLVVAAGCKGKSNGPNQTGSNGASGSGSGSANATSKNPGAAAITLPKSSGTPPNKTTKPLDQAMAEKLAALEFPGFIRDARTASGKLMEVRYKTATPPILGVTIRVSPCLDCVPMELDTWNERIATVKEILPEELRTRPDTTFELGKTDLNGQAVIYSFQFGYLFGKDDNGNQQGSYANGYALYYNDGVNTIRVVAQYADAPVSREDLASLAPRADLEKMAKAFLDTFTHTW